MLLLSLMVAGGVGMIVFVFFFQAEDGIRDGTVTGVQTCALPIWWPGAELNVGHLPERHLRALTAPNQEPADRGGVIPEVTGVTHLHGIALPALHRCRDLLPTERQADHLLRVACREPVAGEGIRIWPDVQVTPPERPLGVDARRAREGRERALDILADALDGLEVRAEDLDREGRPHAGREHIGAVLDRHGPRVDGAREAQ